MLYAVECLHLWFKVEARQIRRHTHAHTLHIYTPHTRARKKAAGPAIFRAAKLQLTGAGPAAATPRMQQTCSKPGHALSLHCCRGLITSLGQVAVLLPHHDLNASVCPQGYDFAQCCCLIMTCMLWYVHKYSG
eukprot:1157888-Pelagomonas_calceolata.AAC.7